MTGGSSGGQTEYTVFDQDISGNIVIGGSSSDPSVVSSTNLPNAFAMYLNSLGDP